MEVVNGTHNARQYTPEEDIISSMPDDLINNILERLPIHESVRTGILSRQWRYKWTMLTQLDFDTPFYERLQGYNGHCKNIINRLLLHLKGPIARFDLWILKGCYPKIDAEDINNWILFLSRKGLKQLTLINLEVQPFWLSSHIFSCLGLSHLELRNCQLAPVSDLSGFPNLKSFEFSLIDFAPFNLGKFLALCPNLESLYIFSNYYNIKESDIAKLEDLKNLYWLVGSFHDSKMITSSQIFPGISSLTKLSELRVNFKNCKVLEDARRNVPTALACLQALALYFIDLCSKTMVSLVVELICASPNLHYLEISVECEDGSAEVDYSRIKHLQLQEVALLHVRGSKSEECLIKSLLACSPLLKTMSITVDSPEVFGDFTTNLLKVHRASRRAKLILVHDPAPSEFSLYFYL